MTDRESARDVPKLADELEDVDGTATIEIDRADETDNAGHVDPATDRAAEEPLDPVWSNAIGAFVLGALDADFAQEAASRYAASGTAQAELALLLPVADILTSLYQPSGATTRTIPVAPTPDRPARERTKQIAEQETNRILRTERRISPRSLPALGGIPVNTVVLAALAVIAVASVLWALALTDKINTRDSEIDTLNRQIAEMRSTANAQAYALFPTIDGGSANGTVFVSPANASVVIDIAGLPELGEDEVFQLWYQLDNGGAWVPGQTFLVNAQGDSVQRLPGEAPAFQQVAVTRESAPGSSEPTEPFLLTGQLAQSNG